MDNCFETFYIDERNLISRLRYHSMRSLHSRKSHVLCSPSPRFLPRRTRIFRPKGATADSRARMPDDEGTVGGRLEALQSDGT